MKLSAFTGGKRRPIISTPSSIYNDLRPAYYATDNLKTGISDVLYL